MASRPIGEFSDASPPLGAAARLRICTPPGTASVLDNSETYESWHLGGGTLLISRHDLERVGGWRRVALGEDRLLLRDVRRSGGRVYRTHGAEYVAVRHGKGHAWDLADEGFVARAEVVRRGFCPTLADIDTLDPPLARDRPRPARPPGEHVPTGGAP